MDRHFKKYLYPYLLQGNTLEGFWSDYLCGLNFATKLYFTSRKANGVGMTWKPGRLKVAQNSFQDLKFWNIKKALNPVCRTFFKLPKVAS